ncbi:MAG: DNA mismatch endonuclease Vsr [Bacteroidales bacterium]|nr:DNA mismatch endonuclease Vsr [Bacteroidales bacterium]
MDTLTPSQRHKNMSAIHSTATKPEIRVRKWLWQRGFRYRLNVKSVPGKPDVVLRKYRTAVFVNGCFWHGHENCKKFRVPKTRTEFWSEKISRNRRRDAKNQEILTANGWQVIVIWECELDSDFEKTMRKTEHLLNQNLLRIFKNG